MQKPQIIRARIQDWQNPRGIIVVENSVTLQVTSGSCNCGTCMRRIMTLRKNLVEKPTVEHAWVRMDGDYCLVLPRRKSEDPLELLAKTLEVSVARN